MGDLATADGLSMARTWSNVNYSGDQPGAKISQFGIASQPWLDSIVGGTYYDAEDDATYPWEALGVIWGSSTAEIILRHNDSSTPVHKSVGPVPKILSDPTNHTYRYLAADGTEWTFADFSTTNWDAKQRGTLLGRKTPGGIEYEVTSWTTNHLPETVEVTYPAPGSAPDIIEQLEYTYEGSTDRINRVTFSRGPSGGSLTALRTVDYSYYGSSEDHGNAGDLKHVTIRDGGPSATIRSKEYYRWYTSNSSPGYTGGLKMFLSGDSYKRAEEEFGTVETVAA